MGEGASKTERRRFERKSCDVIRRGWIHAWKPAFTNVNYVSSQHRSFFFSAQRLYYITPFASHGGDRVTFFYSLIASEARKTGSASLTCTITPILHASMSRSATQETTNYRRLLISTVAFSRSQISTILQSDAGRIDWRYKLWTFIIPISNCAGHAWLKTFAYLRLVGARYYPKVVQFRCFPAT